MWAPGVLCDWGLGLLLEGALLVPVGVRVGAKEGGLDSPTGSGGDEMRQGLLGPPISQAFRGQLLPQGWGPSVRALGRG